MPLPRPLQAPPQLSLSCSRRPFLSEDTTDPERHTSRKSVFVKLLHYEFSQHEHVTAYVEMAVRGGDDATNQIREKSGMEKL